MKPVFRSDRPVTLLGGGPVLASDLQESLSLAPVLAAADGGAVHALERGLVPAAVIGDLDSFDAAAHPELPSENVHHMADQISTDFEKALAGIEAPLTIALGFSGGRVDHELAAYHGLLACPGRRCVILGSHDLVLHLPPRLVLDLPVGSRLSLFPLQAVTGRQQGLVWPIEGLQFHPAGRIGTSNATKAPRVVLEMDGPGMLLILSRAHLSAVVEAFGALAMAEAATPKAH